MAFLERLIGRDSAQRVDCPVKDTCQYVKNLDRQIKYGGGKIIYVMESDRNDMAQKITRNFESIGVCGESNKKCPFREGGIFEKISGRLTNGDRVIAVPTKF